MLYMLCSTQENPSEISIWRFLRDTQIISFFIHYANISNLKQEKFPKMPLFRSSPDPPMQNSQHITIYLAIVVLILTYVLLSRGLGPARKPPVSVNYHFTRQCNKSCGFCFHTATTSFKLSTEKAKSGLSRLKDAGMRKINFAGGEPFIYPKFLGPMVQFCKEELRLESVSIVTNGSLVK